MTDLPDNYDHVSSALDIFRDKVVDKRPYDDITDDHVDGFRDRFINMVQTFSIVDTFAQTMYRDDSIACEISVLCPEWIDHIEFEVWTDEKKRNIGERSMKLSRIVDMKMEITSDAYVEHGVFTVRFDDGRDYQLATYQSHLADTLESYYRSLRRHLGSSSES